jgi:hypothetical protein
VPAEGKKRGTRLPFAQTELENTVLRYFAAKAHTRHMIGRV